jgi:phosphonate transport system substrate-binding protein
MKPVVFAMGPVARGEPRAKAADRFGVMLMALLRKRIDVQVTATYDDLLALIASGEAQLAWLPPAVFVRAHDGHGAELLVGGVRERSTRFRGALFVKSERRWASPEDLRGLRVAWVDRISCSGYLFPRLALRDRGIDPDLHFAAQHLLGDHAAVARAVALGTADVGATFVAEATPGGGRTRRHAGWSLEVDPGIMREVLVTDPIPADTICASTATDRALRQEATAVLAELHQSEHGRRVLSTLFGVESFAPADPADYAVVRRAIAP